jgi:hypothetical protein
MTNAANAASEQRSMALPPVDWGAMHRVRRIMPREARLAPDVSFWCALDWLLDLNQGSNRLARSAVHLSGLPLHDLKSLCLQFQQYALRQVRALFGLDPMRTSPIRVVFLWVTGECWANGGFD